MNCPLKPSLTCAGTPELADEGRCIGCPAGRASDRPRRSLRLAELPPNEFYIILREQLRERLAEEKRQSKCHPLVTPLCHPLNKGSLDTPSCHPPLSPPTVSPGELEEVAP